MPKTSDEIVDAWFARFMRAQPLAMNTACYNQVVEALPALKADLAHNESAVEPKEDDHAA